VAFLRLKFIFKSVLFNVLLFLFSGKLAGQNYVFAKLSGSPMNTSGWNLQGGAYVTNVTGTDNSELMLCSLNQLSGAVFFKQPINLAVCSRWKAEFDFRMYDGDGADGIAFCFLEVPPVGFVTGAGLGIPQTANGLKICFDTWNNCIPPNPATIHQDMPKVEIRWGNGYNECTTQPTRDNRDGKISFIRSSSYNHAKIIYDKGNIDVYVNDSLMVSAHQEFNFTGYLGLTASTGGYHDNHSIKNVVVYTEMPPSVAGAAQSGCPGDTLQVGSSPNPSYTYSWLPSEGLNNTSASAPLVTLQNDSAASVFKTYFVKTAFANNPGCASIDSVVLRIFPKPKVNFISPEICLLDAVASFKDSSFTEDDQTLPFKYQWTFGDDNADGSNPDSSFFQNPSHHYSEASDYAVSLKVTNEKSCVDSVSKIFTVNGAVPKSVFEIENPTALCSNTPVVLINKSTVDFGQITKLQLAWGDSNGNFEIDETPVSGKSYNHIYPQAQMAADSVFNIKVIAYSGISCKNEMTQSIKILKSPQIVTDSIPAVCNNARQISIKPYASAPGFTGNFSFEGNGVSENGFFDPKQTNETENSIIYSFTATNGCHDSASQVVSIIPSPQVNGGPTLYLLKGESGKLEATASGTDLSFSWYPSLYLDNIHVLQPITTPSEDIQYTLTVTGTGGCKDSSGVAVKLLPEPQIPNAFTPNNDGLNDTWGIAGLSLYLKCEVRIYNRYGQLVFFSRGYSSAWDGTFKGQPLSSGLYVYIIDTKRRKKLYRGTVMIIR
jgi:gliding motility-associated-like protein